MSWVTIVSLLAVSQQVASFPSFWAREGNCGLVPTVRRGGHQDPVEDPTVVLQLNGEEATCFTPGQSYDYTMVLSSRRFGYIQSSYGDFGDNADCEGLREVHVNLNEGPTTEKTGTWTAPAEDSVQFDMVSAESGSRAFQIKQMLLPACTQEPAAAAGAGPGQATPQPATSTTSDDAGSGEAAPANTTPADGAAPVAVPSAPVAVPSAPVATPSAPAVPSVPAPGTINTDEVNNTLNNGTTNSTIAGMNSGVLSNPSVALVTLAVTVVAIVAKL